MRILLLSLACVVCGNSRASSVERVLYLGDSMSLGAFGQTFDHAVRAKGHQVFTIAAGGATPYYWLESHPPILCDIGFWKKTPNEEFRIRFVKKVPKVEALLQEFDPSVVVVQTGTNLFAELRSKRRTAAENEKVVERLIEEMCQVATKDDRKLYWITPPDAHRDRYPLPLQRKMAEIMTRVAGRFGEVYDSQSVTRFTHGYPETDGIHYGPKEASAWANLVADDFSDFINRFASRGIVIAKAIPIDEGMPITIKADPIGPLAKALPAPDGPIIQKTERWAPDALGDQSVVVEMELVEKSHIPKISEFTYRRALGVYEWKIKHCRSKNYPFDTIRIAHMICIDKKLTAAAHFEVGKNFTLELVPLSRYPSLERLQTIDTLPVNLELPLFMVKLN